MAVHQDLADQIACREGPLQHSIIDRRQDSGLIHALGDVSVLARQAVILDRSGHQGQLPTRQCQPAHSLEYRASAKAVRRERQTVCGARIGVQVDGKQPAAPMASTPSYT